MFALVISRCSCFYCRYIRNRTGVIRITVTASLVYGMAYVIFQRESGREGKRRENILNTLLIITTTKITQEYVCLFMCRNIVMRILSSSFMLVCSNLHLLLNAQRQRA